MEPVNSILRTYLFLTPLLALLLTEIVKVCVRTIKEGENLGNGHWVKWMFRPGGMPSSHSAFVTSLLIVVSRTHPVSSTEFAIALVFACIVWYDAMSVRYQVGKQAEILNRLQHWRHFSEQLGHSFMEVIVGIAFGAAVTMVGVWLS